MPNMYFATAEPLRQWFTAFPQIVSRVGHSNAKVYQILSKIINNVIREYPHQALWLFASVVKSTKPNRESRGRAILDALRVRSFLYCTVIDCLSLLTR